MRDDLLPERPGRGQDNNERTKHRSSDGPRLFSGRLRTGINRDLGILYISSYRDPAGRRNRLARGCLLYTSDAADE